MTSQEVENLWYGYGNIFWGIAKKVAPYQRDLWEDLVQEAWLRLLECDTTPTTNPYAYYAAVAKNAMHDAMRKRQKGVKVLSYQAAKRLGLLRCPHCYSADVVWTRFWPGMVRCRKCLELVELEGVATGPESMGHITGPNLLPIR